MCMCVNLSFFALSQIKAYTEFRMPLQPQTSAFGHTHTRTHARTQTITVCTRSARARQQWQFEGLPEQVTFHRMCLLLQDAQFLSGPVCFCTRECACESFPENARRYFMSETVGVRKRAEEAEEEEGRGGGGEGERDNSRERDGGPEHVF